MELGSAAQFAPLEFEEAYNPNMKANLNADCEV